MQESIRKGSLATLAQALNDQRTRTVDVVAPATRVAFRGGALALDGLDKIVTPAEITAEGVSPEVVTDPNGLYLPTSVGVEGIARFTDIPLRYARRMHSEAPDLFADNVNHWMAKDQASYLFRLLQSKDPVADGYDGVLRAMLSDRYRAIDSFDVLLAALQGLSEVDGGQDVQVDGDITERRMVVRVQSKAVSVAAPKLLERYRSPFTGQSGKDLPIIWAGFVFSNSETGGGALSVAPRAVIQVCTNGMTMKQDMMREIHLGVRLNEGVVKPSPATIARNLALVTSQVADAVRTFMSQEYLTSLVSRVEEQAAVKVDGDKAPEVIAEVSKTLGFTKDQAAGILGRFIEGADLTAGGVMQAVTAHAQDQANGDDAWDMELAAMSALTEAARVAVRS